MMYDPLGRETGRAIEDESGSESGVQSGSFALLPQTAKVIREGQNRENKPNEVRGTSKPHFFDSVCHAVESFKNFVFANGRFLVV
jgi:hypothetical protein